MGFDWTRPDQPLQTDDRIETWLSQTSHTGWDLFVFDLFCSSRIPVPTFRFIVCTAIFCVLSWMAAVLAVVLYFNIGGFALSSVAFGAFLLGNCLFVLTLASWVYGKLSARGRVRERAALLALGFFVIITAHSENALETHAWTDIAIAILAVAFCSPILISLLRLWWKLGRVYPSSPIRNTDIGRQTGSNA